MKSVEVNKGLVWITVLIFSLSFTSLCLARVDPKDLAGLWLFEDDDDDIVKDLSGIGNDGKINGNPEWADGKFGMAMEYDGMDDSVEVPDLYPYVKDGFTVTFWLYKIGQDLSNRWLFGSYSGWQAGSTSFLIWKDEDNRNNLIFGVQGQKGGRGTCSFSSLSYERWNHIAASYDGSQVRLYVNGNQVSSSGFSEEVSGASSPWFIGYSPGNQIMGMMDDVAIFSSALTINEIKEIMNEGLERALGITAVDFCGKLATKWGDIKN